MLVPKLVTTLRGYDRAQLARDVGAGVIVGIVALPLCIAFAIASGVTPQAGLWTGIVAGLLVSLLGGSRVQIGGPTGAFVVIVFGIVQQYGVAGLTVATMMAGVVLIAMGLFRLGGFIRFVPHPLVTGFTTAIALTIAVQQLDTALGLRTGKLPAGVAGRLGAYAGVWRTADPHAIALTALTLAVLLLWPRVSRAVPAPFVALLGTTAAAHLLGWPVETIGSRFGEISGALPAVALPRLGLEEVRALVAPALTIAALGAIESLLSAVVADGMIGGRHRSNMELVGQGVANLLVPLVGGIPATGAIARTATNVKSGGRTPVAGIVHALTLLAITLLFGRWAALVPLATLAGILLLTAYRMSEWRVFLSEARGPRDDAAVLGVTFALTLLVDLSVAIGVGMILASFLFIRRMAEATNIRSVTRELADPGDEGADPMSIDRRSLPRGVEVYEIDGPFFFGAAAQFRDTLAEVSRRPQVLIIRLRNVPALDSTGLHALAEVVHRSRADGTRVILADVHAQPMLALARSPLLDELGEANVRSLGEALAAARAHVGPAAAAPTGEHAAV